MIRFETVRDILIGLWLGALVILAFVVGAQLFHGKYGSRFNEIAEWCIAYFGPSLALIITVLLGEHAKISRDKRVVNARAAWVFISINVVYLGGGIAVIACEPLYAGTVFEMIRTWGVFGSLVGALLSGAMGGYFVKNVPAEAGVDINRAPNPPKP